MSAEAAAQVAGLKCPSCGASLGKAQGQRTLECIYCKTQVSVEAADEPQVEQIVVSTSSSPLQLQADAQAQIIQQRVEGLKEIDEQIRAYRPAFLKGTAIGAVAFSLFLVFSPGNKEVIPTIQGALIMSAMVGYMAYRWRTGALRKSRKALIEATDAVLHGLRSGGTVLMSQSSTTTITRRRS